MKKTVLAGSLVGIVALASVGYLYQSTRPSANSATMSITNMGEGCNGDIAYVRLKLIYPTPQSGSVLDFSDGAYGMSLEEYPSGGTYEFGMRPGAGYLYEIFLLPDANNDAEPDSYTPLARSNAVDITARACPEEVPATPAAPVGGEVNPSSPPPATTTDVTVSPPAPPASSGIDTTKPTPPDTGEQGSNSSSTKSQSGTTSSREEAQKSERAGVEAVGVDSSGMSSVDSEEKLSDENAATEATDEVVQASPSEELRVAQTSSSRYYVTYGVLALLGIGLTVYGIRRFTHRVSSVAPTTQPVASKAGSLPTDTTSQVSLTSNVGTEIPAVTAEPTATTGEAQANTSPTAPQMNQTSTVSKDSQSRQS